MNKDSESMKLVRAWIRRYEVIEQHGNDTPEAESLFWAFEKLDELCRESPEYALAIIENILSSTDNDYVIANLAAGPLENLLAREGARVIDAVEERAGGNPRFKKLLQGVWQNLIDERIWKRVQRATEK